jgi:hypothetical protein
MFQSFRSLHRHLAQKDHCLAFYLASNSNPVSQVVIDSSSSPATGVESPHSPDASMSPPAGEDIGDTSGAMHSPASDNSVSARSVAGCNDLGNDAVLNSPTTIHGNHNGEDSTLDVDSTSDEEYGGNGRLPDDDSEDHQIPAWLANTSGSFYTHEEILDSLLSRKKKYDEAQPIEFSPRYIAETRLLKILDRRGCMQLFRTPDDATPLFQRYVLI